MIQWRRKRRKGGGDRREGEERAEGRGGEEGGKKKCEEATRTEEKMENIVECREGKGKQEKRVMVSC